MRGDAIIKGWSTCHFNPYQRIRAPITELGTEAMVGGSLHATAAKVTVEGSCATPNPWIWTLNSHQPHHNFPSFFPLFLFFFFLFLVATQLYGYFFVQRLAALKVRKQGDVCVCVCVCLCVCVYVCAALLLCVHRGQSKIRRSGKLSQDSIRKI